MFGFDQENIKSVQNADKRIQNVNTKKIVEVIVDENSSPQKPLNNPTKKLLENKTKVLPQSSYQINTTLHPKIVLNICYHMVGKKL